MLEVSGGEHISKSSVLPGFICDKQKIQAVGYRIVRHVLLLLRIIRSGPTHSKKVRTEVNNICPGDSDLSLREHLFIEINLRNPNEFSAKNSLNDSAH